MRSYFAQNFFSVILGSSCCFFAQNLIKTSTGVFNVDIDGLRFSVSNLDQIQTFSKAIMNSPLGLEAFILKEHY